MPFRAIWMPIIVAVFGAHTSEAQDSVDGFLAGNDNLRQISGGNTAGTHLWTSREMQARHPA